MVLSRWGGKGCFLSLLSPVKLANRTVQYSLQTYPRWPKEAENKLMYIHVSLHHYLCDIPYANLQHILLQSDATYKRSAT